MSSGHSSAMNANGAGAGGVRMTTTTTTTTSAPLADDAAVRREREDARVDVETARGPGRGTVVIGVLVLAAIAAAITAFATREGAGLTPDSRGYLLVAEQIQLGNGLTMLDGDGKKVPLTHCPPLYPMSLWAGGTLANGDRAAAARLIGIALFALNVALVGMIAWRASGRSAAAAMLAAGLTAVGLDLVLVHSMVWTEPMFILATFAALYFLGTFIDTGRRGALVISAIFAAMSFGTRYAGASLVLTCGLLLMFGQSPRRTWGRRIVDAFIHGSISCFGMFAFLIRNAQKTRDADGHAFAVHLPNRSDVKNALVTVAGWVVPVWPSDATPMWLVLAMMAFGLIVAVAVIAVLILAARNARATRAMRTTMNEIDPDPTSAAPASASRRGTDSTPGSLASTPPRRADLPAAFGAGLRRALIWFLPVYVGFVLVSVSFFDAHVPLDRRILSPVHVALILLVVIAVVMGGFSPRARRAGVVAIALLIAFHGVRAVQWAAGAPQSRHLGYANREWRSSPTMAAAATLPDDLTIFSNGVDAIYLRANRFARPLPKVNDPTKAARDPKFRKYMLGLRDFLETNGGYVVYFNGIPRAYIVTESELLDFIPMEKVSQLADGAIYRRLPNPPGTSTTTSKSSTASTATQPTQTTP